MTVRLRWQPTLTASAMLAVLACGAGRTPDAILPPPPPVTPPPPPPAMPLALVVSSGSQRAVAQVGTPAPDGSATVILTGTGAASATWSASAHASWISFVESAGTGSGSLVWHHGTSGLGAGTFVDTIVITADGADGSPRRLVDTLETVAAPVPLALGIAPTGRSVRIIAGESAPDDSVSLSLTGDGAATASWSAAAGSAWTTLLATAGTGSALLRWHRATAALPIGTWVDTITVTAPGAAGSPGRVYDTVRVTAAPVPLSLVVTPHARRVDIVAGEVAPADSAAVVLSGDGAATTGWTATHRQGWITLTNAAGTGSGVARWTRQTGALAAGTWVDTITVTAAGAAGSPALLFDSVVVVAAPPPPPPPPPPTEPDLGRNGSLHGKQVFPTSDPWNQPVDTAQVDPNSTAILTRIGLTKHFHPDFGSSFGIPYVVVPDNQPRVTVPFDYADESDPGPYPIPPNPPIEDGGDAHLLIITRDEWKLYELFALQPDGGGWQAGSGAIFDLLHGTQRPAGWTSADAAGLPIFPGLVRYDEVYEQGEITHALRFTVQHTRRAYIPPATHWASSSTDPLLLPMGARVRLKANVDISSYPAPMQVILRALKKYGMIVADNGSDFFLSGTDDSRWNDAVNDALKQLLVQDFEVVRMTGVVTP